MSLKDYLFVPTRTNEDGEIVKCVYHGDSARSAIGLADGAFTSLWWSFLKKDADDNAQLSLKCVDRTDMPPEIDWEDAIRVLRKMFGAENVIFNENSRHRIEYILCFNGRTHVAELNAIGIGRTTTDDGKDVLQVWTPYLFPSTSNQMTLKVIPLIYNTCKPTKRYNLRSRKKKESVFTRLGQPKTERSCGKTQPRQNKQSTKH